jgi:hypothetical protein
MLSLSNDRRPQEILMNLFSLLRPVAVLLLAAGSVSFSASASGEERDYRSHSTAVLDLATGDFVATGNGTHLGKYTESGNVSIVGGAFPVFLVAGSATLTDKSGDELWVDITGMLDFSTGTITGTITFVGGKGRFEEATGSASVVALFETDGLTATIAVVVAGTIDF